MKDLPVQHIQLQASWLLEIEIVSDRALLSSRLLQPETGSCKSAA